MYSLPFFVAAASLLPFISAIPSPASRNETSSELVDRDGIFDWSGSTMCRSLQVKFCDEAVNSFLIRDDVLRYGTKRHSPNYCHGSCSGLGVVGAGGAVGCGIWVEGKNNCQISGSQLWRDYQEIRASGAKKCGGKKWGDGCKTKIDYVAGCTKGLHQCAPLPNTGKVLWWDEVKEKWIDGPNTP